MNEKDPRNEKFINKSNWNAIYPMVEEQEARAVGEPVGNRRECQRGFIIIIRARFRLSPFPQA